MAMPKPQTQHPLSTMAKGKRGGGGGGDADEQQQKVQAVLLADSFNTNFRPISYEMPKVRECCHATALLYMPGVPAIVDILRCVSYCDRPHLVLNSFIVPCARRATKKLATQALNPVSEPPLVAQPQRTTLTLLLCRPLFICCLHAPSVGAVPVGSHANDRLHAGAAGQQWCGGSLCVLRKPCGSAQRLPECLLLEPAHGDQVGELTRPAYGV